jgi:Clathrin adaptor complex small chain
MDLENNEETNAAYTQVGWNFIVLMSRQGKIRLSEFFHSYTESEKRRILRDIAGDILPRAPKMCNIIEKGTYKFVYRRYASLYFVVGVPLGMNELIVLEQIHLFVEALDGYFNSGACLRSSRLVPHGGFVFVSDWTVVADLDCWTLLFSKWFCPSI